MAARSAKGRTPKAYRAIGGNSRGRNHMSIEAGWTVIGAVASILVLVLYILVEFIRPRVRRYKLKRPCDVTFVIPSLKDAHCEYAVLDDEWHSTKEITVPPQSELYLELDLEPRLNFVESEFAFGCDGGNNLDTKPFAVEYVNRFVDRGKKGASPENDEDHYTDRDQYYHIKRDRQRSVGQHFVVGLIVKTRDVGQYRAEVWVTTEEM
jgi:hypothetical protein